MTNITDKTTELETSLTDKTYPATVAVNDLSYAVNDTRCTVNGVVLSGDKIATQTDKAALSSVSLIDKTQ